MAVLVEVFLHQIKEQSVRAGLRSPRSSKIWPSDCDLSATQTPNAATSASRSMKLFCKAKRPKSRLSAAETAGRAGEAGASPIWE